MTGTHLLSNNKKNDFYSATRDSSRQRCIPRTCAAWERDAWDSLSAWTRRACGRTGKGATSSCKLPQTKSQAKLSRDPASTETGSLSWSTTSLGHRRSSLSSVAFPSLLWNWLYLGVTWLLKFQTLYLSARGSKHLRFSSWSGNSLVTFLKNKSKLNKVKG